MIKGKNAQHTRSRTEAPQRRSSNGSEKHSKPHVRAVCLSQVTTARKVGDSHRLEAELAPAITPSGKLRPH